MTSFLLELFKYFAVSLIALLFDYSIYLLVIEIFFLPINLAGTIGYAFGLVLAYFLISKKVFNDGWLKNKRGFEILLFALSGSLGILLTFMSMTFYTNNFDQDPHFAKMIATLISFIGVYLFRKLVVFKKN